MTGLNIMATAIAADYVRDPTRWGRAEVAAHFPGFEHADVRTSGAVIRLRHGGSGPPLLLVHGNPQNHSCWYRIKQCPRVLRRICLENWLNHDPRNSLIY